MTDSDWISVEKAESLILEHHLKELGDYVLALQLAWSAIVDRLVSGELPARTVTPQCYRCVLLTDREQPVFPLGDLNTIPPPFWIYYTDAARNMSPMATIAIRSDQSSAWRKHNDFNYTLVEGIVHHGRIEGRAEQVELLRKALPGQLPAPRGRPRGRKWGDLDDQIAWEVIKKVDAGMTQADAVNWAAPKMEGAGLDAKKTRLRQTIKALRSTKKK